MEAKEWVIQKCNDAFTNNYENWPGYSETLLTKEEMLKVLAECENKWPTLSFRGHNVINQNTQQKSEDI